MANGDGESNSIDPKMRDTRNGDPSGLERALDVDPGTMDLGDDVNRNLDQRGGLVGTNKRSELEGGLDAGNTDLGDDVYRK